MTLPSSTSHSPSPPSPSLITTLNHYQLCHRLLNFPDKPDETFLVGREDEEEDKRQEKEETKEEEEVALM